MSLRTTLNWLYLIPPPSTTDSGEDSQGSGAQIPLLSHGEEATALSHLPGLDPPPREAPLTGHLTGGQPGSLWEIEMERPQDPDPHIQGPAFDALGEAVNSAEEAEDLRRDRGEGDDGGGGGGDEGGETEGYECVVVTTSLTDRLHKRVDGSAETSDPRGDEATGSQPDLCAAAVPMALPGHMPRQGELFHAQTLQTVVASCEIPVQQGSLEGSQVTD